jgi:RNA polymerase subunit RPABC4/transcription elongation factor Spt4
MFLLDWPGGSWEATLRISLTILALYLAALWVTLVFWTYRDIRQRTRDPIIQTVAVLLVLVFFLPGHWIYLILRPRYTLTELYERSLEEEALLQELEDQKACPGCNRRIVDEFLICPYCRASLKEPCRGCSRPLNRAWIACPYCGMEKPAPPRPVHRQPASQGRQRKTRQPAEPQRAASERAEPRPRAAGPFAPRPAPSAQGGNGRSTEQPQPAQRRQAVDEVGMIDATND